MRTLADILRLTSVNPEIGHSDASVAASSQQFGRNALTPLPREPIWKKFIEKFDEPIIKILLAATLLSMIVDLFKSDDFISATVGLVIAAVLGALSFQQNRWAPLGMFTLALVLFLVSASHRVFLVEGFAVMIAILLATGVAFLSEYKSDREFEALNAEKESLQAKVLRGGQWHSLPLEEIVVGDVVLVEMGDEIPADGRLLKSTELMLDQSLMTGESEPVHKSARPQDDPADGFEQPGCVYRGTQVMDGVGHLLVIEVGDQTYLGQLARRLATTGGETDSRVQRKLTISKELTPLQEKLAKLAQLISKVGYAAAGFIFLAELLRGILEHEIYWPTTGQQALSVAGELLGYFVTMVIIIVVAVPEGLPMSVTVSLALAMRKMTRANSLVRQLVACETIGSATVICTDKTGTLTQNKMQVEQVAWDDKVKDRGEPAFLPSSPGKGVGGEGVPQSPNEWIALCSAVNSTANLEEKQGRMVTIGNSTEGALLQWLREAGLNYTDMRSQTPALFQIHFSSERKRMTSVVRMGTRMFAIVKGAPDVLIGFCSKQLTADGSERALNESAFNEIRQRLRDSASRAMRTLAFAYRELPAGTPTTEDDLHALRDSLERDLIYVGFIAIRDPLREDVKAAVAECREAGIEIKMITGDNVETARAIGHDVGLISRLDEPIDGPEASVITSSRFNEMTDDELKQQLPILRIIARAKPLDKYRLVKLLQEMGEVVAVTGDGTNDAPALKKADVGLAMGITGTEVAKEASKIVLLDDAFSTIVHAVHWGRSLYENIQRFVQFQLTINVSALAITFLGILVFNVKAPFTVLQLLWINVIMDTLASIALCSEPPRPGIMQMPPKKRDENILTNAMLAAIFSTAGFFVVVMLTLLIAMKNGFLAGIESPGPDFTLRQKTLFFSIYVLFQIWNLVNARSLSPEFSGLERLRENPTFLTIAGLIAVSQIVIVTFGGRAFQVEPLGILDWLGVTAFTASVVIFGEALRRIRNKKGVA